MGGDGDTISMNLVKPQLTLKHKATPRLKFSAQYLGSNGESQSYVHYYKYNPMGGQDHYPIIIMFQ